MKKFIIKCICVFFVSILASAIIGIIFPKTVYYYMNASTPKREITETSYKLIYNSYDKTQKSFIDWEYKYVNKTSITCGIISFAGLMILISLLELRNKHHTN